MQQPYLSLRHSTPFLLFCNAQMQGDSMFPLLSSPSVTLTHKTFTALWGTAWHHTTDYNQEIPTHIDSTKGRERERERMTTNAFLTHMSDDRSQSLGKLLMRHLFFF